VLTPSDGAGNPVRKATSLADRLRAVFTSRRLLEAALILAVIFGAQYWQTRDLPDGAAPPLAGLLTDGKFVEVSAGGTASSAPTLVAFWATWCPVCSAEEGNIVAVAQEYRVISVAMQSGDAATVGKHLKERAIDLPALIDADGRHAMSWGVRGVPTHFVVDAAGNVRFRVVGYATTWGLKARLWWAENFKA
jgi:thiol-disulfide isomerase/thioredoxin